METAIDKCPCLLLSINKVFSLICTKLDLEFCMSLFWIWENNWGEWAQRTWHRTKCLLRMRKVLSLTLALQNAEGWIRDLFTRQLQFPETICSVLCYRCFSKFIFRLFKRDIGCRLDLNGSEKDYIVDSSLTLLHIAAGISQTLKKMHA